MERLSLIKTINDISLVVSICKIKGKGPDFFIKGCDIDLDKAF